jgi:hypothetical protein
MRLPIVAASALVLLAACTPATTAGDRSTLKAPSITGGDDALRGAEVTLRADAYAIGRRITAEPDAVFAALDEVYAEMGIPVTMRDHATRTLGNNRFSATRRMAGGRMTEYMDCGTNRGLPNAESYTVRMDIRSTVAPDGEGASTLSTIIQASARANDGTATQPIVCRTLTKLEERIGQAVMLRAVK